MIVDMTEGSPMKVILRFAIPMFISVLFQQLYSLVDSVIAGQYVGLNALAAVSVSYPIISLLTAVANGINVGCSVVVSQIFGAKKEKELKSAIFTSMITIFLTGIILTALGLAICEPVMRLLQTPADIFEDSVLYLQIYIAGFVFLYLYNGANAIYTALGDSRTPLYFLIFSSLFNIVLDLLFVVAFQMGVAGLALATDLAMGVSAALALFFLNRKLKGYLVEDRVKFFDKRMFREIVIISVPSILQASSVSLGNLLVQGLINSYGSLVVAGSSAGAKLNILLLSCMSAMGNTLASYSAQNMGAHSVDRMKRGLIEAAKITMIMMSVFMLVTFVFAEQCIGIFIEGSNEEAIEIGALYIRMLVVFYPFAEIKMLIDSVLRGAGCSHICFLDTAVELVFRVVVSYVLAYFFGIEAAWCAWGFGWMAGMIIAAVYYAKGKWQVHKTVAEIN